MKTKIILDLDSTFKIWFTSDLHFGHKNVLSFCKRPFTDVKEMDKKLVSNWNECVGYQDFVFHLGDFSWFDSNSQIQKTLKQLKGKIYLIPGNHDTEKGFRALPEHVELLDSVVQLYLREKGKPDLEIYLSHYPLMTWPHREKEYSYNFFGHIHSGLEKGQIEGRVDQDLPLWSGKQYDVGVDNNHYYPIDLDSVLEKIH